MNFKECFYFDESSLNPIPNGWLKKVWALFFHQRYSMTVLMRLSQYFYKRNKRIAGVIARFNEVLNNLDAPFIAQIERGIILGGRGIVITENSTIETGVVLHSKAVLAVKNGKFPHIKKYADIGASSVILGVIVGERAVIGAGAIVTKDIPDDTVAAGNPSNEIKKED